MRVATYNIHHGADAAGVTDLARTAEVLADLGADLVGLQEVDRHWGERSGFVDQAAWLGRRLGMRAVFGPNLEAPPRPPGEAPGGYGNAVLSAHPVVEWRRVPLPGSGGEPRGLLLASVQAGPEVVRFATTHLDHACAAERRAQAAAVAELLDAAGPEPVVLTGDLNAVPGAPELTPLTACLRDTWPLAGADGLGHTFPAAEPQRRIDYVLVGDGWTVERAEVVPASASDHLPYVVDLARG